MQEETFTHEDKIKATGQLKLEKATTRRAKKYGPDNLRLKKSDEVASKFVQVILRNKTLANFNGLIEEDADLGGIE